MGVKKILESQGYGNLKTKVGMALIVLVLALVVFSLWFLFFYAKPCDSEECFVNAMVNCKRVSLVREDSQASWLYTIRGSEKDLCNVEVKLLKIKQGNMDSENLQGKKMSCLVQKASSQFPEKDISKCTGVLKEELQNIIIKRMHNYLLENVGEIQQEFEGF